MVEFYQAEKTEVEDTIIIKVVIITEIIIEDTIIITKIIIIEIIIITTIGIFKINITNKIPIETNFIKEMFLDLDQDPENLSINTSKNMNSEMTIIIMEIFHRILITDNKIMEEVPKNYN
jgi:hypothetical protein